MIDYAKCFESEFRCLVEKYQAEVSICLTDMGMDEIDYSLKIVIPEKKIGSEISREHSETYIDLKLERQ